MERHKQLLSLTREQLETVPTDVLDALIALDPGPTAELTTDTVLTILEILEERIGKEPTPELDAVWEKIKAEYLK